MLLELRCLIRIFLVADYILCGLFVEEEGERKVDQFEFRLVAVFEKDVRRFESPMYQAQSLHAKEPENSCKLEANDFDQFEAKP